VADFLTGFLDVVLAAGFGAKRSCKKSSQPACAGRLALLQIATPKTITRARKQGMRTLKH
jgi:hypothetical protein